MATILMKKEVEVEASTLKIHMKVCDTFSARLLDHKGEEIYEQEDGYVPSFMPGPNYGDYLILDIDIETGQITNWKQPTSGEIEAWVNGD